MSIEWVQTLADNHLCNLIVRVSIPWHVFCLWLDTIPRHNVGDCLYGWGHHGLGKILGHKDFSHSLPLAPRGREWLLTYFLTSICVTSTSQMTYIQRARLVHSFASQLANSVCSPAQHPCLWAIFPWHLAFPLWS